MNSMGNSGDGEGAGSDNQEGGVVGEIGKVGIGWATKFGWVAGRRDSGR